MECDTVPVLHDYTCNNYQTDIDKMREMLATDPEALERRCCCWNEELSTPLLSAARIDHDLCVEFLLNSGANSQALCDNEDLMAMAVESGGVKTIKLLVNYGFDVNYKPEKNEICGVTYYLYKAVENRSPDVLEVLIDSGAKVEDFQNFEIELEHYFTYSPCVHSIFYQCPKSLLVLLLRGAAIDHRQVGRSDLSPEVKDCLSLIHHFAVASRSLAPLEKMILNILYQLGANLWQKNRLGLTPLQVRGNEKLWYEERRLRDIDETFDNEIEPEANNEITVYLRELMGKPLSLQSLSRIAIMRAMGTEYSRSMYKLPTLPRQVKAFLRGRDLPTSPYDEYLQCSLIS